MTKDLAFKKFWEDVPSVFKGSPDDITKIINGRCDFEDLDDKYIIELELPGVKKEETEINLRDGYLTVSWSRKKEKRKVRKSRYEIREGSFKRSFLVDGADPDNIDAKLNNGILTITVSKLESYKAKKIQIN